MFVFFQAEDGIRDLVRSRGLGDVYKRQAHDPSRGAGQGPQGPLRHAQPSAAGAATRLVEAGSRPGQDPPRWLALPGPGSVSYTHLTLPTSDLV